MSNAGPQFGTVIRVELPSGGWLEIESRPTWRHIREWATEAGRLDAGEVADRVLVSLTAAWSFRDEVCVSALSRRSPRDLTAAFEALNDRVLSPLTGPVRQIAEELFTGLVTGTVQPGFAEAHIMAVTGWDWATLQDTPADVVQRMAV